MGVIDKKDVISCAIIVLVIVLIRTFIITPVKVNGTSMVDTLHDGDFMLLKKYDKDYVRFDIVVVNREGMDRIIKRIIGKPKEEVEYKDNKLYIDGKEIEDKYGNGYTNDFVDYCGEDEYFVMGDNREDSTDSRVLGCMSKEEIEGTTSFIFFPFDRFGSVK